MERMAALQGQVSTMQGELQAFADSDPETLAAMREGAAATVAAANRWLDNLMALQVAGRQGRGALALRPDCCEGWDAVVEHCFQQLLRGMGCCG